MPRRIARPDTQVARLAAELGRRWVAADGIEPWLRRQLPRLAKLVRDEGWSWGDIGRAMTAAGITYATNRPWTGRQLARKAADARAQLRAREGGAQAPAPLPTTPAAPPAAAKRLVADEEYVEPPRRRTFGLARPRGWDPSPLAPAMPHAPAPQPAPVVDVDAVIARFLGKA